jgi:Mor family transcriptional regulator
MSNLEKGQIPGLAETVADQPALRNVFDMLPGQDRKSMTPEEFQAVIEVFVMLAKARDDRAREKRGRPGGTLEPNINGVSASDRV